MRPVRTRTDQEKREAHRTHLCHTNVLYAKLNIRRDFRARALSNTVALAIEKIGTT